MVIKSVIGVIVSAVQGSTPLRYVVISMQSSTYVVDYLNYMAWASKLLSQYKYTDT